MSEENKDKLVPAGPVRMEVAIGADRMVATDEAIEAMRRAGDLVVKQSTLRDLETLGIYVKGAGVWKMQRGRALIKQARADEAMGQLLAAMRNASGIKSLEKRYRMIGDLAGKLSELMNADTRMQELVVSMEEKVSPGKQVVEEAPPEVIPFAPGKAVRTNQLVIGKEVHLHQK